MTSLQHRRVYDPRGSLDIALYILNIKAVGLIVSEIYGFFSHYKSKRVIDPQGMASLNSWGLIGMIYVVEHYILLYTKYIWFQRRFLKFLSQKVDGGY